ncbi:hypothetical protein N9L49_02475 [Rhodospirillales bacterium]|nr:hypothetical protein [Rhodospirillales bacterium]
MDVKNTFAGQFSRTSQAANKAEFEVRFGQIQNGLLRQQNTEIQKVRDNGIEDEIATLQAKRDKLLDRQDEVRGLQSDLETNASRFQVIQLKANEAIAAADADENGILSDDEVTALNAATKEIFNEIFKLNLSHTFPNFTDGNLGNFMRQEGVSLDGLTAVAGTLDAEGTDPPTNDNRAILDALSTISGRAATYAETTTVLYQGLTQLVVDISTQTFDLEFELSDLTSEGIEEQLGQIEDIENRYGNLIRSISLAFEVQSGLADILVTGTQFDPPRGSILNIFS